MITRNGNTSHQADLLEEWESEKMGETNGWVN